MIFSIKNDISLVYSPEGNDKIGITILNGSIKTIRIDEKDHLPKDRLTKLKIIRYNGFEKL